MKAIGQIFFVVLCFSNAASAQQRMTATQVSQSGKQFVGKSIRTYACIADIQECRIHKGHYCVYLAPTVNDTDEPSWKWSKNPETMDKPPRILSVEEMRALDAERKEREKIPPCNNDGSIVGLIKKSEYSNQQISALAKRIKTRTVDVSGVIHFRDEILQDGTQFKNKPTLFNFRIQEPIYGFNYGGD
jgi:hypothetical protein